MLLRIIFVFDDFVFVYFFVLFRTVDVCVFCVFCAYLVLLTV